MTRIKLCGLSRPCDIEAANLLKPDYVGFVFATKSKRCVTPRQAGELKRLLAPGILAVGVFVDEVPETIAGLLNAGVIDMAQLHGGEGESDICAAPLPDSCCGTSGIISSSSALIGEGGATSILLPQYEQNFASSDSSAPHFEHLIISL